MQEKKNHRETKPDFHKLPLDAALRKDDEHVIVRLYRFEGQT